MVDIVTQPRDDQDNSQPRLAPTTYGPAAQAAAPAAHTTRPAEFVAGASASPPSLQSPVGHVTGSCPACSSGQQHWSPAGVQTPNQVD